MRPQSRLRTHIFLTLPLIITSAQARDFQLKHPCADTVLRAGLNHALTEWNHLGIDWPETFHVTQVRHVAADVWEVSHEDSWSYVFKSFCDDKDT